MTPSNFSFLEKKKFAVLQKPTSAAEYHLYTDHVATLIDFRRFAEKFNKFVRQITSPDDPSVLDVKIPRDYHILAAQPRKFLIQLCLLK